jgi:hypothetical protein
MATLNALLTRLFDALCVPWRSLPPVWALLFLSFVAGVGMVWVFGKTSNQKAIGRLKDRIRGSLIGVRLYRDDVGIVLRLQGRIIGLTGAYLAYSLVPILFLIVPTLLILAQLNLRFSVEPLTPGLSVTVTAKVRDARALDGPLSLEAPVGVVVETPPVRAMAVGEVSWRIRATKPGDYKLLVHLGDETIDKSLKVGEGWSDVSATRASGALTSALWPGEPPIPSDSTVESVAIAYDPLELRVFGWKLHWLVGFLLVSILAGFACKGLLGVEI